MAKWSLSFTSLTPTATADATNLVDATYPGAIQGGSATQRINVYEIYMGGQAPSTSSPCFMVFARDSQVATGSMTLSTNAHNAALDTAVAALAAPQQAFTAAATNKPQRSATLQLLMLPFNAFGGIVRWRAGQNEEISQVGNTASLGETSLSAFTGGTTGLMGTHILYETF